MEYSIEGGTYKLPSTVEGVTTYVYRFNTAVAEHVVVFTADVEPKIGDRIVNGVLVPLVGNKINDDTTRWVEYYGDVFPEHEE